MTPADRARELLSSEAARAVWCAAYASRTDTPLEPIGRALDALIAVNCLIGEDDTRADLPTAAACLEHMRSRTDAPAGPGDSVLELHHEIDRLREKEYELYGEIRDRASERDEALAAERELRSAWEADAGRISALTAERDAARSELTKLQADVKHHVDADIAELVEENGRLRADLQTARAQLGALATLARGLCDAYGSTERDWHRAAEQLHAAADAVLGATAAVPCTTCFGTGVLKTPRSTEPCGDCNGTGTEHLGKAGLL